uniref:Dermacentor 9 kDa family member n=1 Tax=Rhipicephalus appendiculatus TaxID=34631 RepID=A0A131Z1Q9_RHIAP
MAAKVVIIGILMLAFVALAYSVDPECPKLKCLAGNKVACFIDDDRCHCGCVTDDDPCESLRNHPCPEAHSLACTSEAITCTCRCVLK